MTININIKDFKSPSIKGNGSNCKTNVLFLPLFQIHICTRAVLLSLSFSLSVLFNFQFVKTDVFKLSCPGTKKQTVITSRLDPSKTHI